jgi:hypothetical protein
MRRIVVVALLLVGALMGCGVDQQFVRVVDEAWSLMGPEYKNYVQADPKLDDDQRARRIRLADETTKTIEEAKD